jgi:integrase
MARRHGHVGERGPGRWEVSVPLPKDPETGRRRKVSRLVRGTRADAERRLRALAVEVDNGDHAGAELRGGSSTYAELVDRWLEAKAAEGLSPSTVTRYRYAAAHLKSVLGTRAVEDIDVAALEALYGRLTRQGQTGASVRKVHQVARGVGDMAVRYQLVRRNPADDARPPRVVKPETDAPAPDDVRRLVKAAMVENPVLGTLLHVGAATGARRGELLALRWTDLAGSTLRIRRAVVLDGSEIVERTTKTGKSRNVSLDAGTLELLEELRATSEDAYRRGREQPGRVVAPAAGDGSITIPPDAFIFAAIASLDRPYRPDSITWWFRKLARSVGVDCTFYEATRHFHASELVGAGVDLRTIADRLGHDPRVLLERYAHLRPGRDEAAAETIGELLSGGG